MLIRSGGFDYGTLDSAASTFVEARASEIRAIVKRTAESIMAIGENLIAVKARLPHGSWLPWLAAEFGWGESTAKRFIQVAEFAAKSPKLVDLSPRIDASALYLLARPSTSSEARSDILSRAEAGEKITHKDVQQSIRRSKERDAVEDNAVPAHRRAKRSGSRSNRTGPIPEIANRPDHLVRLSLWLRNGPEIIRQFADYREALSLAGRFSVHVDPVVVREVAEFMADLDAALNADRAA